MDQLAVQVKNLSINTDSIEEGKGENKRESVILLLDLDCYEVQLWLKHLRPDLVGKDVPVVVINHDFIVLSVNYTAKRLGIKRSGKGQDLKRAEKICKDNGLFLEVVKTGTRFEKSDSFRPVMDSDKILWIIQDYQSRFPSILVNRSSNDEFYLDISEEVEKRIKFVDSQYPPPDQNNNFPNTINNDNDERNNSWRRNKILQKLVNGKKGFTSPYYRNSSRTIVEGRDGSISVSGFGPKSPRGLDNEFEKEKSLFYGALIAQEIMTLIYNNLGYLSSVGVAHNKSRAKLASDLNKPEGITILTDEGFERLARTTFNIDDLVGFKGEKGERLMKQFEKMKLPTTIANVLEMDQKKLVSLCQPKVNLNKLKESNLTSAEGQSQAEKLVEDLLIKCQGIDESLVSTKVYSDTMSVSTSFKGGRSATKRLINLLCNDMWSRLNYARESRRLQATALGVKVQIKSNFPKPKDDDGNDPDLSRFNQMELKETEVPTRQQINHFVFSFIIKYLFLKLDQVDRATLTATQFVPVDVKKEEEEKAEGVQSEEIVEKEVDDCVQVPKEVSRVIEALDLDQIQKSRISVMSGSYSKGGRTSLTFWIVNMLLKKMKDSNYPTPGVIFIDFDIGQSKFTPPGVISVTKVEKPLIGPVHHLGHSIPIRSIYLGELEPTSCARTFVMGMQQLCEFLDGHDEYKDYPRVLHTTGIFSDFAVYLNSRALNFFQPTLVIQLIKSGKEIKSEFLDLTSSAVTQYLTSTGDESCKSEFSKLTQQIPLKDKMPEYQYLGVKKEVRVAPQIGMVSNLCAKMNTRGNTFHKYFFNPKTTRHFVSLTKTDVETGTGIGIGIEAKNAPKGTFAYETILQSFDGELVALCTVPVHLVTSLPSAHPPSSRSQAAKFNVQCIRNTQNIAKDFHGYGFVRGHRLLQKEDGKFDVEMEIISPVSPTLLQSQVNCIIPANRLKFSPDIAKNLNYWAEEKSPIINFQIPKKNFRQPYNNPTFRK